MSEATRRYMRLLVFFDLPVTTREKRRIYTIFRRFLIQDGYDMNEQPRGKPRGILKQRELIVRV